jgi:acyl-CoA thioester hydrolase
MLTIIIKAMPKRSRLKPFSSVANEAKTQAENLLLNGKFKDTKYTHCTTLPVRWIDSDMMGHVNNATYFTYFEQIRCEAFDEVGLKIGGTELEGPIIAKTSCTFRGPVEFPDTVTVGAVSEQTSDTTWTQKYAVVAHSSGRVVAEGEAELVWFDYKEGKRKSFSDYAMKKLFGIQQKKKLE